MKYFTNELIWDLRTKLYIAQKIKFSIKDFFSECDQICKKHFLCSAREDIQSFFIKVG